ncbi:uncharacterized protein LOC8023780 [Ixodes scapularis]|uniref:uncharacterized protein LOC8023780 n=1 Tax=Ixodes scapularis TaxID=6945 RepID=UPI001C38871A|nr:uncharacterized protein LOC8023780 [Ixodes scapularis]
MAVVSLAACLASRATDARNNRSPPKKHRRILDLPMAWARARRRDPSLSPVIFDTMPYSRPSECCPSVTEAIQPLGGVSITGRILELYREDNATQRFYQTSCRDHVRGRPCRFMRSKYEPHSRCVQTYSYMYALVREFQSDAPWRLDYIRYRNGCTCQIQRPRTYKKRKKRKTQPRCQRLNQGLETRPTQKSSIDIRILPRATLLGNVHAVRSRQYATPTDNKPD